MSALETHSLPVARPALADLGAAPRVLLIRPRKIGDVVLLTPVLRALRGAFPRAWLVALIQPPCDEVLANNPHVDEVWRYPVEGDLSAYVALARRLRRARFDVAVDAFGTPATARLSRVTRAQHRIGLHVPGRAWAYSHRVPLPRHGTYAAHAQAQLLEPLGVTVDNLATEMFPAAGDWAYADRVMQGFGAAAAAPVVAIGPAVSQEHRRWPPEGFARLADALVERWGVRILFVHGLGEQAEVAAVRAAMRQRDLGDYAPSRTIPQLAALLTRCALFIGHDTGTRHVAIALGVPTVGIFGKSRPESWTPPDDPRHRTVAFDPGCKGRCVYPHCPTLPCIREITPHAVLAEAESLLGQAQRERSRLHA